MGTQNPGIGYLAPTRSVVEKWVEGKLKKAFLHFLPNVCQIFAIYLMIFQRCCEKLINYGKNVAENDEKPYSTCLQVSTHCLTDSAYPIPRFWVPVPPLLRYTILYLSKNQLLLDRVIPRSD